MDFRVIRRLDVPLFIATLLLITVGILMIWSATTNTPDLADYPIRHAIYAAAGLIPLFLAALADYRGVASLRWLIYLVLLGLLGVILIMGQVLHGGQRWFDVGLLTVQPSELAKPLMVLVFASFLAGRKESIESLWTFLLSLLLLGGPVALIYMQPDLGTALVLVFVWGVMVFAAGVPVRYLVGLAVGGVALLPAFWGQMEGYMRNRLAVFLNPEGNPAARYNVDQALISIGSGGVFGKGFRQGSQSQLHFLRIRHTDYIFSVIGEELGLVGSVLVIGLFAFLIHRMLRMASLCQDTLGQLIIVGMAAILFFQSVVNMGVNLGLLPVTGIPLPFVSSGGSSLLTFMFIIGLVQGVYVRRKRIDF
jgi:rod shape determining protein RodA